MDEPRVPPWVRKEQGTASIPETTRSSTAFTTSYTPQKPASLHGEEEKTATIPHDEMIPAQASPEGPSSSKGLLHEQSPLVHSLDLSGGSTVSVPMPTQQERAATRQSYEDRLREELLELEREEKERKWEEDWGAEEPLDAFGQPVLKRPATGTPRETTRYRVPWEWTTPSTTTSTLSPIVAGSVSPKEETTTWKWKPLPPLPDSFEEWHKSLTVGPLAPAKFESLEDPNGPTTTTPTTPATTRASATWPNWQFETWATPPSKPRPSTTEPSSRDIASSPTMSQEPTQNAWTATSHSSEKMEEQPLHKPVSFSHIASHSSQPPSTSSSSSLGTWLCSWLSLLATLLHP